jgi:hypothetical protein
VLFIKETNFDAMSDVLSLHLVRLKSLLVYGLMPEDDQLLQNDNISLLTPENRN